MNIEISTKFNLGDTIYLSTYYIDEFFPSSPHTVTCVGVRFDQDGMTVEYDAQCGDVTYNHLAEVSCFATYEECAAWCEKRNSNPGVTL